MTTRHEESWTDEDEPKNDLTAFLEAIYDRLERDVELLEAIAQVIRRRRRLTTPKAPSVPEVERADIDAAVPPANVRSSKDKTERKEIWFIPEQEGSS